MKTPPADGVFPVGRACNRFCHSEEVAATDEESAFAVKNQKKQILRFLESDGLQRSPEIGPLPPGRDRNDKQGTFDNGNDRWVTSELAATASASRLAGRKQ